MTVQATPQLARDRYNLSSDDDCSDSSLEILPPTKASTSAVVGRPVKINRHSDENSQPNAASVGDKCSPRISTNTIDARPSLATRVSSLPWDGDSSDSDDDVLLRATPSFASSKATKKPSLVADKKAKGNQTTVPCPIASTPAPVEKPTLPKEDARARQRREREERKQQEKVARAEKREREKAERERLKEDARQTKKRQTEELNQASGKFAHKEIALLFDTAIYSNSEYDLVSTLEENFHIEEHPSALTCNKCIQWVRREYLQGGAEAAYKFLQEKQPNEYQHLPYCLLILEPEDFIPLLRRSDEEEDFPALASWIEALKNRWKLVWNTTADPKIILLLRSIPEAIDRQWVDYHRQPSGAANRVPSPPRDMDFEDAMHYILIQFQVECIPCASTEMIHANVHKLTRGLAEAPYFKPVSELECIRKIKHDATIGNDPFKKASDTFLRQLQKIPRVSETGAGHVLAKYPTLQSLWQAYQQTDEPAMLLANCLGNSRQVKLSESIHRLLTSNDPQGMIL